MDAIKRRLDILVSLPPERLQAVVIGQTARELAKQA
jgi:hypothetical protein